MGGEVDAPKRQKVPKGVVVPIAPVGLKQNNDIVPTGEPEDPPLLKFKPLKRRVDGVKETVHVPRSHTEATRA
jgi:hypothetical protein